VLKIQNGEIVSASSNAPEDHLGAILCQHGLLNTAQLRAALDQQSVGQFLGDILVQDGLINRHDLFQYLQVQIKEIFFSLLMLEAGHYVFFRELKAEEAASYVRIPLQNLLMQGFQHIDEMKFFREKIPSFDDIYTPQCKSAGEHSLASAEKEVFYALDGKKTLRDVSNSTHLGEFGVTKAAYKLLAFKLISKQNESALPDVPELDNLGNLAMIIDELNDIIVKLHTIINDQGRSCELTDAIPSFVRANPGREQLFSGITLQEDGTLDAESLLQNAASLDMPDSSKFVRETLRELLFFMQFMAGDSIEQ
jgi:hypothetical protein